MRLPSSRLASSPMLTIPQAAERVGVSPATIRQWMHRGHLRIYPARVLGPDRKVRMQLFACLVC